MSIYIYIGDVLKSRLVSYCIVSLVSVGRLLGHLLWLTGKCVQLNWSSILLDGYKKRSLPPGSRRVTSFLVWRTEECKDHRLYCGTPPNCQRDIIIAFYYLLSYSLFHFCFSFYNQFLQCVSCCLLACVWQCSFFRITDKLLPFDLLSIWILDKLCMNLLCLYRYFL